MICRLAISLHLVGLMRPLAIASTRLFIAGVLLMATAASAAESFATEADVAFLEKKVRAGNRAAVQAAFRLRVRSDGAVAEYGDWVLGSVIQRHPKLFLEELQHAGDFRRLDSILGNLGPDYVDRIAAQAIVLKARTESLRKVKDPALREIRDRCVTELKALITQISLSKNAVKIAPFGRWDGATARRPLP